MHVQTSSHHVQISAAPRNLHVQLKVRDAAMGKLFLEHPGGRRLYACASCATVLTNKRSLVSTSFHGMSGTAYLFNNVVNVLRGDSRTTDMRTGRHIVQDVYCKRCQVCLRLVFLTNSGYREAKITQFFQKIFQPRIVLSTQFRFKLD